MDLAALAFSTGWASGVNAWATVFALGVVARFGDDGWVPSGFGDGWVLALSGAMFALEFIVDKIAYLDTLWDTVSTVVRPLVGTVVTYHLAQADGSVDPAIIAALGGGTALLSHGVKSGLRLAVNASPEPVSNAVVSTGEDLTVVAVIALALANPMFALVLTGFLLIAGIILVVLLWRIISSVRQRIRTERA